MQAHTESPQHWSVGRSRGEVEARAVLWQTFPGKPRQMNGLGLASLGGFSGLRITGAACSLAWTSAQGSLGAVWEVLREVVCDWYTS